MPPYNKVVFNGKTLIDLSEDTVAPETLAEGVTAHSANGEKIVGTMIVGNIDEYLRSVRCTLQTGNWIQDEDGKYIQSVTVEWMTENWKAGLPILESSTSIDDDRDIQEAFGCIDAISTGKGVLIFACYYVCPQVNFTCIVPRFVV